MRKNHLICFGENQYCSEKHPWQMVDKKEATVFVEMKKARQQLNHLNGRLMKGCNADIVSA